MTRVSVTNQILESEEFKAISLANNFIGMILTHVLWKWFHSVDSCLGVQTDAHKTSLHNAVKHLFEIQSKPDHG